MKQIWLTTPTSASHANSEPLTIQQQNVSVPVTVGLSLCSVTWLSGLCQQTASTSSARPTALLHGWRHPSRRTRTLKRLWGDSRGEKKSADDRKMKKILVIRLKPPHTFILFQWKLSFYKVLSFDGFWSVRIYVLYNCVFCFALFFLSLIYHLPLFLCVHPVSTVYE